MELFNAGLALQQAACILVILACLKKSEKWFSSQ